MTAIDLLFAALPAIDPPEPPELGTCCLLGTHEPTVPRKLAILPSFTNLDLLRAPDSDRVSVRAWRVLTHTEPAAPGKKRDRHPLLQSSWICNGESWMALNRTEVRDHVLAGVPVASEPWCGYVTTSYKKHGSLRAPVNTQGRQRWLWETEIVDCTDRTAVQKTWDRLLEVRTAGIPRPVIESLDPGMAIYRRHGTLWLRFERWARLRFHSRLYRFLCYLLPGKEELHEQSVTTAAHGQLPAR